MLARMMSTFARTMPVLASKSVPVVENACAAARSIKDRPEHACVAVINARPVTFGLLAEYKRLNDAVYQKNKVIKSQETNSSMKYNGPAGC